ncbi:hypothetical protein DL89DRAFT_269891 [Linderina pennispora]|uniref:Uncharacterized protein n=1 Tax=Linderina pennispora TaxID=61395 RepID=A0A1Y1W0L4_9FUNG|nr:uncharacterized protein DL89DRAFT_269891 [Linderina pennispora]ORX66835.1 hypothetical protein DL89DRAFT_269891 [Linderina pennispora]
MQLTNIQYECVKNAWNGNLSNIEDRILSIGGSDDVTKEQLDALSEVVEGDDDDRYNVISNPTKPSCFRPQ